MRISRWWAVAGVLGLALMVAACGGGGSDDSSNQDSGSASSIATGASPTQAAANVRRGGTMLVAMELNPQRFDPMVYTDVYSGRVVSNVFDTLVRNDENLVPQPYLAEKIDQPDNLTYIVAVRQGVKFQDGTDVDADAVKFSIDRIRDYKAGPSYADSQYIADTQVMDKYTIKIALKEPYSPFLSSVLAGRIGTVVSPTAVKTMGDEKFSLNPVGSGPFKFVEWKNDNYIKVVRNDGYWKQGSDGKALPYLDGVEWRIITEPTTRLTALQSGDVQISAVRDQDLAIVKGDATLVTKQQADFGWGALLLSVTKPPFDNKALRQAVTNSLDRDEIVRVINEGNAVPALGPIGPAMAWARDESYKPYDPNKVKDYLAQGGKPNGFEFTAWFSAGSSSIQQLAELMQAQMAKYGIKMNIEYADFNGVVIPKAKAKEPGAFSIGFSCGPDPDACVYNRFASDGSFNYMGYGNPMLDQLLKSERATSNREERAQIFKNVNKFLVEESPAVFTTHGVDRFAGSKKVQGWYLGYKYTQGYAEYWLSQ